MTKNKLELEAIWSQEFWDKEAEKIELAYYDIIKDILPKAPAAFDRPIATEHRIEQFVRKLSRKHNIGNLHVGLTSSDIEDNIRVKRLTLCNNLIQRRIDYLREVIEEKTDKDLLIKAKTHLLDADYISLKDRFAPSIIFPTSPPLLIYKGIGGAIGIGLAQKYLGISLELLNKQISYIMGWGYTQVDKHQTGDHMPELLTAQWLQHNAMLLGKICNDIRMMFAFGQAVHEAGDVASTAIVSKKTPNPWRYEKASAILDEIFFLPTHIARIGAHCLLERTLTNQSALNRLFERAYSDSLDALNLIEEALDKTIFVSDVNPDEKLKDNEIEMIRLIKEKGIGREEAYRLINKNIK